MRFLTLCLTLTVAANAGCGAVSADRTAASPPMAHGGAPMRMEAVTKVHEGDTDHDGIPDQMDKAPDEERMASLAPMAPPAPPPAPGQPTTPATPAQAAQREGAYLIYTANLTMAVYQVEGAVAQVEQIGRDSGGFLSSRQDRSITIRVPRERFDEAIAKIEKTGDIIHRDIKAEDVGDEFMDTTVRLKNARAMRDRLQDLLQKAAVKDALEIEKELGRITQDIERMEGRLKLLKDKIAFSTITVTFDARATSLKTMPIRLPFGWLQTLGLPSLLRLNETK